MSDEFDAMKLPDELRDVVGRLRELRPVTAKADEAACMYRAGWQAALASQAAPKTLAAGSWSRSYFGGLISGAVVSGSLTAALVLGVTTYWKEPEAVPTTSRVAQQAVVPAADALAVQTANDQPDQAERSGPVELTVAPGHAMSDEGMATAYLSPMARRQWREILTQAAAPYASPWSESAPASQPTSETLRSSPHDIDVTWF